MTVIPVPEIKPKSDQCIIEALRGFVELGYINRITFLEITAVIDGQVRAFSITTGP